jgi:heptosyltransferase-2
MEKMSRASLAITNDSGLMHVAVALGIPTVAIFGPTVREFGFYPRAKHAHVIENSGLDCRPCTAIGREDCPKGHFLCMKAITPEIVIAQISTYSTSSVQ